MPESRTNVSAERKDNGAIPDATGIRVLLVEDNEMNQQVATELLESAGAIVMVANHGGEAVKILTDGDQAPAFDVVFMDLQMPEMDGFTATRLLRRDASVYSKLTDYCDDGARARGRAPALPRRRHERPCVKAD